MSDNLYKLKPIEGLIEIGSLIKDGPVSQIYSCFFKGDPGIIRIDKSLRQHFNLNRIQETEILQLIQDQAYAPEILYSKPKGGLLITRLIEGQLLTQQSIRQADHLKLLAEAMRSIHQLKPSIELTQFNDFILNYQAELRDLRTSKILSRGFDLFRELNQDQQSLCFCHNDLNHTNVLISNSLKILDWEYSSLNNPYFDLSTVIEFHNLNEGEIEVFLSHYEQGLAPIDHKLLQSWQLMSQYINMFWLMILQKYDTISDNEKSWMNDLEKRLS